jgi:hypothetical protein
MICSTSDVTHCCGETRVFSSKPLVNRTHLGLICRSFQIYGHPVTIMQVNVIIELDNSITLASENVKGICPLFRPVEIPSCLSRQIRYFFSDNSKVSISSEFRLDPLFS